MKKADQKITLFNSTLDPVTGYQQYPSTIFNGVSVYSQTQVNVDKEGLSSADLYTIRIPVGSTESKYLRPVDYKSSEDNTGHFTFNPGDVIVLGEVYDENPRPGELEKKYGRDYAVTIIGVTDNRFGSAPHWKVLCK